MHSTHTWQSYPSKQLKANGAEISLITEYPDGRKLFRIEFPSNGGVGAIGYSAWAERSDEEFFFPTEGKEHRYPGDRQ